MNDITAARDYQGQLEHQANYDLLTDLPNRALLQDRTEVLLKHADAAMHSVKARGCNDVQFHTPAMSVHIQPHAMLENALRLALERDELRLD